MSQVDLEACGYWSPRQLRLWRRQRVSGLVPLPASNHFGIRKGRTARRVRRCLRREQQRLEATCKAKAEPDVNEGLYGGPPQVG